MSVATPPLRRRLIGEPMAGAIAMVMRIGVGLATAVGLIGGAIDLARHGGELPRYHIFVGEPSEYRSLLADWGGILAEDGRAIIQAGVMILMAVPVVVVGLAVAGYLRARGWAFVIVTGGVLVILLHGLLAG
jgi:uncharacterized membrane protein